MNTRIKYRTFDELLDSVRIDLKGYDYENVVEPQELIKVAVRVNKELGLRINPTMQKCIPLSGGICSLPADLDIINFAYLCETSSKDDNPNRTYIEKSLVDQNGNIIVQNGENNVKSYSITTSIKPGSNKICHGLNSYEIIIQAVSDNEILDYGIIYDDANCLTIISNAIQTIDDVKIVIMANSATSVTTDATSDSEVIVKYTYFWGERQSSYNFIAPIRIVSHDYIAPEGFHMGIEYRIMGRISGENLIINSTADNQCVYLNYQSLMENEEGHLLVCDHPVLNEYYELAIKKRILENLLFANEPNVGDKLKYFSYEARLARNNAISLVRKPEYTEIRNMWEKNRRAQVKKYFSIFGS